MFESKQEPVATTTTFARRLLRSLLVALLLLGGALMIGVLGYHAFFGLGWVDSIYNASMILTGMGPVDRAPSDAAKLFASGYALFSGIVFLTVMAIVLAPVAHRVLHLFHSDEEDK